MNIPLPVDTNTESFAETLALASQKLNQLLGKKLDPEALYPTLADNIERIVTPNVIRALCEAWQIAIAGPTNARETLIDLGLNFTRNLFEIYAQIAAHLDTATPLDGKQKPSSEALTAVAQRTQIFVRTAVATGWHIKWSMLRRTAADPMLIRAICALILHIEHQAVGHNILAYRRLLQTTREAVEQELMSLALLTLAAPESLASHQIGQIDDLIRHRLHSLPFREPNNAPALAHIELSSGQISRRSPSKPGAHLFIPLALALDKLATILANNHLPPATRHLYEQIQTRWLPPGERLHREITLTQGWLAWGFSTIIRSERQHAWDTPQNNPILRRCISLDSNESGRRIWIRNAINLDLQPGTLIAFSEDISNLRRLALVCWIRRDNAVGIEIGIRIQASSYTTSALNHIASDGRIIQNYHNECAILPETGPLAGPLKIDLILSSGNAPTALALSENKLLLLHHSNTQNGYDHCHERYYVAPRLVS